MCLKQKVFLAIILCFNIITDCNITSANLWRKDNKTVLVLGGTLDMLKQPSDIMNHAMSCLNNLKKRAVFLVLSSQIANITSEEGSTKSYDLLSDSPVNNLKMMYNNNISDSSSLELNVNNFRKFGQQKLPALFLFENLFVLTISGVRINDIRDNVTIFTHPNINPKDIKLRDYFIKAKNEISESFSEPDARILYDLVEELKNQCINSKISLNNTLWECLFKTNETSEAIRDFHAILKVISNYIKYLSILEVVLQEENLAVFVSQEVSNFLNNYFAINNYRKVFVSNVAENIGSVGAAELSLSNTDLKLGLAKFIEKCGQRRACTFSECNNIEKDKNFKKCRSCRTSFYCSQECQKQDWKKHKQVCDKLEKLSKRNKKRHVKYYPIDIRKVVFSDDCQTCGKINNQTHTNLRCSRCKTTYYCSVDCQKKDWKQHKRYCGK